jgi:peptidoglycan hydrolase-like protein with peptidoglycan-binding domain
MKKNFNVEAEGGELILSNKTGDHVIIPKNKRDEVKNLLKEKCFSCIDKIVNTLPIMEDYADDGTIIPNNEDKKLMDTPKPVAQDNTRVVVPSFNEEDVKMLLDRKKEEEDKQKFIDNNRMRLAKEKQKQFNIEDIDVSDLKNLSTEQIKEIQSFLVSKGLLKGKNVSIDSGNEEEVMRIQEILKSKGYDLGKYGKNKDGIDGIYGKMTKKALTEYNKNKEIDGIVGNKTIKSFRQYKMKDSESVSQTYKEDIKEKKETEIQRNLQQKGYFKAKEDDFNYDTENILLKKERNTFKINNNQTCNSKECAYYVNQEIEQKIKTQGRERIGAYGDAWTIYDNLMRSGAQEIYNAFPNKKQISTNPEGYLSTITDKKVPVSPKDLRPGDVIHMYYGGSPNVNKAYQQGSRVWSTHLGLIKEGKNGELYVEHNVNGKIYREPLNKILNNESTNAKNKPLRITAIVRPQYNLEDEYIYEPTSTEVNFDEVSNLQTKLSSREAAEYSQVLLNNQDLIMSDIPISKNEFDNLVKAVRIIGWKESNYQSNPKSKLKSAAGDIREFFGIREASKGYSQLKDEENIDESIRTNLNINNETLTDVKRSSIATMYALSTKYLKIKESLSPSVKMTPDEIVQLALISWNEPIDKVIQTANKYKTLNAVRKAYKDSYGYNEKNETLFPYDLALTAFNKYVNK